MELTLLRLSFPWCCRYKERGVMFCHDAHDCNCDCHGTLAPLVPPREGCSCAAPATPDEEGT